MRIAVIGLGAVGARAARQLASTDGVDAVLLRDERPERLDEVAASLGPVAVAEPAAITRPARGRRGRAGPSRRAATPSWPAS